LNVFDDGNWCDLPMDGYDFENGNPSPSVQCADATVVNSDGTFNHSIASGDTYILPDTTYNVYVNEVLQNTITVSTLTTTDINIVWQ
jgi:hypothetical protein